MKDAKDKPKARRAKPAKPTKTRRVQALCQACGGSGTINLCDRSPELAATAELIESPAPRSGDRRWTAADVAKRLRIGHTAALNRLTRLVRMGVLEREYLGHNVHGFARLSKLDDEYRQWARRAIAAIGGY